MTLQETTARAWQKYGPENQLTKTAEECNEFSAAWLRWLAGYNNRQELIGEAADVIICAEYLKMYFNSAELQAEIERKLNRLEQRMKDGHQ